MKYINRRGFHDEERTKPVNSTAALKWVLSNPDVITVIPGMTDFDQLELNIKILADVSVTDADKNDLVTASSETGLYFTGCTKCLGAFHKKLPVPGLMRAYMYAYGYAKPGLAQSLLGELGTDDIPCKNCAS